ncbi:hypothetical protein AGOR_G00156580 [Albula goreensis]|uniref:TRAF3 interacting protein 3 n=1 Tax=Albula goreensis TaxID=1534307 RepID=A0A8T3D4T7_9TELE|nr:hypothetical protein AGOR_G00156580 [Albula goreensis]
MATQKTTILHRHQAGSYDQKFEQRATKHECLRDRNNVTTCRSPGKQLDLDWKRELQRKRQQEFLKRRQISHTAPPSTTQEETSKDIKVVLRVKRHKAPPLNRRSLVMAQDLGITWPDISSLEEVQWLKPPALHRNENRQVSMRDAFSSLQNKEGVPQQGRGMDAGLRLGRVIDRRERGVQTDLNGQQRDSSAQTECGFVTVRESDLLQLADYLQEALWREETLKQKLVLLQHSASALLDSYDELWTTHCNEDLLKSRIAALEAQLQMSAQKFSRDEVKKAMLQTEERRHTYEKKALLALQKAAMKTAEAEKKAEGLEEALQAARSDLVQWQGMYVELKEICDQQRRSVEQSTNQLHLLQSQLERASGQEADLQDQLGMLQRDGKEWRSQITLLEEDNQAMREQLKEIRAKLWQYEDPSLRGHFFQNPSQEMWGSIAQLCVSEGSPATSPLSWGDSQSKAQLQDTQQKLRVKEKECEELRADLEAMELECQTSQARLAQCREELKLQSTRRKKKHCCSWLDFLMPLLIIMAAMILVLVCFHPIFGSQLQDICRTLKQHMEWYLQQMALSKHSQCYRPI